VQLAACIAEAKVGKTRYCGFVNEIFFSQQNLLGAGDGPSFTQFFSEILSVLSEIFPVFF